ncbi:MULTISPECIES: HD domain-containing protein [Cellulophaga]|uniref:Phosphohydrolase n=1 Tax=Cellulophaga baltica 18 TaxID=1348584 RepID=A0AAU8RLB8_9FLAO|nr:MULTISPECIES: HD domain-containing protein [Cellulophaga]AIZ43138.1 phosphohydrolase [Cellulophaga baltica 18]KGK31541.1 phosphohydrolase [Cellulophaga sp. E6(2014)]MCR1024009.1 HD domain-containing protein [Cellulophaga baltica]WFO16388.1 HD domain-containing protein [Cellulophaga baltica 4]
MIKLKKLEIFNDPIYGFINIPTPLVFSLIAEPSFQRLRRISQMGMSYLVYPGAHHTRFHHALGCMHLMQQAVQILRIKDIDISEKEEEGLLCAILLHDIGHGPFSHAMEHSIVEGVSHEYISLQFMESLNEKFKGKLETAIAIFKGEHPKKFLNQLVSSQLDIDRLDYLKRDSFYTGVAEGNINSERLITMLNVVDNELVVERKGIYSVEKFLMARRFMYWQVYLHKTGLVAEQLLISILKRAKELLARGEKLACSDALMFFMTNKIGKDDFTASNLNRFASLDDVDILSAIKQWQNSSDFTLSKLSEMILNRELLQIKIKNKPISLKKLAKQRAIFMKEYQLNEQDVNYFVYSGIVQNQTYDSKKQNIKILNDNGKVTDVVKASDQLNLKTVSKITTKYYICYPKLTV